MTPRTLVTVRPGPVLHLWQDGREVARVALDTPAALALIAALAAEVRASLARGEVATDGCPKTVPDENGFLATAADLGLRRNEIHEARRLRNRVVGGNATGRP
jgi:hypothetical protein